MRRPAVGPTSAWFTFPVHCMQRFAAISGYDRALGLAAQAFLAVIPTLVVVASVTTDSADAFSRALISRFGLSGSTARVVQEALQPPGQVSASVWGVLLLVVSGMGFARALQRSYRAAWGVQQAPGLRGWLGGMAGVVALAAGVVLCATLASLLARLTDGGVLLFLLRAAASGALWLVAARLLLGRQVTARALLPGALVAGAGQALIWLVSGIYIPRALAAQASSYGVVGVCAVLITWLITLTLLVVLAAVVSAELRPGGGPEVGPEEPDEPGEPGDSADSPPTDVREPRTARPSS